MNEYNINEKKRIIIKIGSSSLTHSNGKLNLNKIDKLARQLVDLKNQNKDIVLVSSGAIAVGCCHLGLQRDKITLAQKQAAAAVGQAVLMKIYEKLFGEYNQKVAQILITKYITDNAKSNICNTFEALFNMGVIPIVNENDTVATDEIDFGDNDTLSAVVSVIVKADLLILLSDIEGLYTDDPRKNSEAQLINTIDEITEDIENLAGDSSTTVGTGGMITKIQAAKLATKNSIDMIIASANDINNINRIFEGQSIGTMFLSH